MVFSYRSLMCKEIVPTNQAGILAYLSSGVIKGVGPEIAKAIVARFGDKTMEVLDKGATEAAEHQGNRPEEAQGHHRLL